MKRWQAIVLAALLVLAWRLPGGMEGARDEGPEKADFMAEETELSGERPDAADPGACIDTRQGPEEEAAPAEADAALQEAETEKASERAEPEERMPQEAPFSGEAPEDAQLEEDGLPGPEPADGMPREAEEKTERQESAETGKDPEEGAEAPLITGEMPAQAQDAPSPEEAEGLSQREPEAFEGGGEAAEEGDQPAFSPEGAEAPLIAGEMPAQAQDAPSPEEAEGLSQREPEAFEGGGEAAEEGDQPAFSPEGTEEPLLEEGTEPSGKEEDPSAPREAPAEGTEEAGAPEQLQDMGPAGEIPGDMEALQGEEDINPALQQPGGARPSDEAPETVQGEAKEEAEKEASPSESREEAPAIGPAPEQEAAQGAFQAGEEEPAETFRPESETLPPPGADDLLIAVSAAPIELEPFEGGCRLIADICLTAEIYNAYPAPVRVKARPVFGEEALGLYRALGVETGPEPAEAVILSGETKTLCLSLPRGAQAAPALSPYELEPSALAFQLVFSCEAAFE